MDAFWSFVKKAPRPWRANRPVGRGGPSVGMSDPGPAPPASWWPGLLAPRRTKQLPWRFSLTRQRTAGNGGVPWISDGRRVYRSEVVRVYRDPQRTGKRGRPPLIPTPGVGLTQAIKQRRRGRIVRVEVRTVMGEPPSCPYAVCVERLNGVLRDRLNALTRKTHGFAKRPETWDALIVLCLFEHNWMRPHPALRRKPRGFRMGGAISSAVRQWQWD